MRKAQIAVCLMATALISLKPAPVHAQEDVKDQIKQIEQQLQQMDTLKTRLDDLQKQLDETKKTQDSAVTTALKGSKLKIDGRIFVGTFGSGDGGTYPDWSTDISDAKLRFTFNPSKRITIVNRLSTTGATTNGFDYFYLDYGQLFSPVSTMRLGQRKIDVGQETWVDNPVENMLISNSVSAVSGYGTGLALVGRIGEKTLSPFYEVGYVNGPKGVMVRPSSGLPYNVKVGAPFSKRFFMSGSYFNTGKLNAANQSAISVDNLSSAPAGAVTWERNLWEADLRYNYGINGIRPLDPTGKLPKLMVGATYGQFNDNSTGSTNRDGNYWFVETMHGFSSKLWAAARYSATSLDNGYLDKIGKSPVAVNSYNRTSLGLGYALTDLTQVKIEYSINNTSGGASSPSLNQFCVGVCSKF